MGKVKIITADQAAALVEDNTTVTTSGFVASGMPEALTKALEKKIFGNRFSEKPDFILRCCPGKP